MNGPLAPVPTPHNTRLRWFTCRGGSLWPPLVSIHSNSIIVTASVLDSSQTNQISRCAERGGRGGAAPTASSHRPIQTQTRVGLKCYSRRQLNLARIEHGARGSVERIARTLEERSRRSSRIED